MKKILTIIIIIGIGGWVLWRMPTPNPQVTITIPYGASSQSIAHRLKKNHVIRSKTGFILLAKLFRKETNLHAGDYTIPATLSWQHLFSILQETDGPSTRITLTVVPGMALKEIADTLYRLEGRNPSTFMTYVHTVAKTDLQTQYPFLATIPVQSLEGYLFPDTYYYAKGLSTPALVRLLVDQFHQKIVPLWQTHPTLSFHDMVTLASIIEKEAVVPHERSKISAVFHNRLRANQPLQSCPTVAYALKKYRKKHLSYTDLNVRSPYNTYRVKGLPPTPIATISLTAFQAALKPQKNFPYYYFVAIGNGQHHFSKTYAQHIKRQKQITPSL